MSLGTRSKAAKRLMLSKNMHSVEKCIKSIGESRSCSFLQYEMLFSLPAKQNTEYLGIVEITTPNFLPLCQKQTNQNNYLLPQPRKIYSLTA